MKKIIKEYFIKKTNATYIQLFRYIFVGGLAAIADISFFYIVNNILYFHYLIAQTIGFVSGLIVNYSISVIWIFESEQNIKKVFLFVVVGIAGLIFSYLVLWFLIDILNIRAFQNMLAKITTIILVFIWNLGMRKKFVFN